MVDWASYMASAATEPTIASADEEVGDGDVVIIACLARPSAATAS